jgi:hypothetical protein
MLEADHLKSPTGSASQIVKTTGLTNARALDGVDLEVRAAPQPDDRVTEQDSDR